MEIILSGEGLADGLKTLLLRQKRMNGLLKGRLNAMERVQGAMMFGDLEWAECHLRALQQANMDVPKSRKDLIDMHDLVAKMIYERS